MMMRVKFIPQGPDEPRRRVALPTYNTYHYDDEHGTVLVDVPADVLGPEIMEAIATEPLPSPAALAPVAAQPSWLPKWYKYLDERYPHHEGEYRPEFA